MEHVAPILGSQAKRGLPGWQRRAAAVALAHSRIRPAWLAFAFALGVVALAELLVELVEYPLLYGADAHARAYYDTIADLAATLVGGVVGTVAALAVVARR